MPIVVNEDLLRAVVTKDKALSDGRTLVRKGALKDLRVSEDRSLLWGLCQGSGANPYEISTDLIGDNPVIRCTCPVKPPPCKHTLGVLVAFMEQPQAFTKGPAPAPLLEKRGKNLERAETDAPDEADALVEDLLGHVWELAALKARGWARANLRLFELADERLSDRVRGERVEQGWMLDLDRGDVLVERRFRPIAAIDRIKERDSYEKAISIADAGIYPGFVNRRVRWEIAALASRPLAADDFAAILARAQPTVEAAIAAYKEQIRNPLAPDDAVVLLRAADVRSAADGLALVDGKGAMLVLRDSPLSIGPHTSHGT